jgi:hypothetical protein
MGHLKRKLLPNDIEVLKTYKIYIGGQFPRTESGRYYIAKNSKGEQLANRCALVRVKIFVMPWWPPGSGFEKVGPHVLHLTVDKFCIVSLKCWKEEKRNLLKS